jgi:hypothetical protein
MKKNLHVIKIPHLNYRVVVEEKRKDDHPECYAYTEHVVEGETRLCIPFPIGKKRTAHLVHELIHVLQWIARDRELRFLFEEEHLAYLADWLFDEIMKL